MMKNATFSAPTSSIKASKAGILKLPLKS